jgi:hypothetical protein
MGIFFVLVLIESAQPFSFTAPSTQHLCDTGCWEYDLCQRLLFYCAVYFFGSVWMGVSSQLLFGDLVRSIQAGISGVLFPFSFYSFV